MTKDEALQMAIDYLGGSYDAHRVRKACQEALENPLEAIIRKWYAESEYLYVWKDGQHHITFTTNPPHPAQNTWDINLIGKIKLEPVDG